jgi:organic radical activating enzyme
MLNGERPPECAYCWKIEDSGGTSDRTYKSAEPTWGYPYLSEIPTRPWHEDVDPSYVEVSFSNVCNFKCSYCAPHISSQWMEEVERYGPYPTSMNFNNLSWIQKQKLIPIPNNQDNPYVDAFWEWWPKMYKELKVFRITGGEPLLSKNTFKVLDYIIGNPNPDLVLAINTNMCVPDALYDQFINKLKIITESKLVQRVEIYTSAEAHGKQAEYIRFGMDYTLWLSNMEKMLTSVPLARICVMSTFNVLSIITYKEFLSDILALRKKFVNNSSMTHRPAVAIDIPYLRNPNHQTPYIITSDFNHYIEDQIKFMEDNPRVFDGSEKIIGFEEFEIVKLRRTLAVIETEQQKNHTVERQDFVKFVDEHDRRRETNFLETFPQLASFYHMIKEGM